MSEKYILICSQKNGTLVKSDGGPVVLEHGAEARLKTYLNGVVKGLLIAGFKTYHGYRKIIVAVKDDVSYEFEILSQEEWMAY